MPWRFDRVHVAPDGTAWVTTTFSAEDAGGWAEVAEAEELAAVLTQVLDDSVAPEVVSIPAEAAPAPAPAPAPAEPGTAWFSLSRLALGGARRAAGSRRSAPSPRGAPGTRSRVRC